MFLNDGTLAKGTGQALTEGAAPWAAYSYGGPVLSVGPRRLRSRRPQLKAPPLTQDAELTRPSDCTRHFLIIEPSLEGWSEALVYQRLP